MGFSGAIQVGTLQVALQLKSLLQYLKPKLAHDGFLYWSWIPSLPFLPSIYSSSLQLPTMTLSCSSSALAAPDVFGTQIVAFDVSLVHNYSGVGITQLYYGHPTVTAQNISFCNITMTYTHPGANDTVHVETWLPTGSFNGRLQAIGGGGWVAGRYPPSFTAMTRALAEGYATTTTDAGLPLALDYGPDEWAILSQGNPNLPLLNNLASISLNDQVSLLCGEGSFHR